MEKRTIERLLPCRLTPEEFDLRAAALVELDEQIDTAEAKEKARAKAAKEDIGALVVHKRELRTIVGTRTEPRRVVCEWGADWASKSMLLRRTDTLEIVETRTMTPDELQLSLDDMKRDLDANEPQ